MKTHLCLFSGIGGFSIAAQRCGFTTVGFCEIEPYAQQVLIEKFGAVLENSERHRRGPRWSQCERLFGGTSPVLSGPPILHPDVFTLDGTQYRGVTLVTGGFPCQPFSCAGKRRGKEDDRHLWPQMLRVIAEARPAFLVAENVPGIIGMELDNCLSDLEAIGYACRPLVVPACAVDARHRRDRVWILAVGNARCNGGEFERTSGERDAAKDEVPGEAQERKRVWVEATNTGSDVADADQQGPQGWDGEELRECSSERIAGEGDSHVSDSQRQQARGLQQGGFQTDAGAGGDGREEADCRKSKSEFCRIFDGVR